MTISKLMIFTLAVAFILAICINPRNAIMFCYLAIPIAILSSYLLLPQRLRQTHWIGADPIVEPLDPRGPEAPPGLADVASKAIEGLGSLGFDVKYAYKLVGSAPNLTGYAILLEHPDGDVAKVVWNSVGGGPARHSATGYTAEFEDGTEVATFHAIAPSLFPAPRAPRFSAVIPKVDGPAALYNIHRGLVARHAAGKARLDHLRGGLVAYQARMSRLHRERMLACGYYRPDESGGRLRLTHKGATLMTWKQLWPGRPIRNALRDRRANRLIRELGLERGRDQVGKERSGGIQ